MIRLYPLYALGTIISLSIVIIQGFRWRSNDFDDYVVTIVTSLLFLPTPPQHSIDPGWLYPLNYPAWSLFFELAVNAAFAGLALRLNGRLLAAIATLSVGFLVVYLFEAAGVAALGPNYTYWHGGFSRVSWSFFVGVIVYRAWATRRFAWVTLPAWLPAAGLLAIFAVPADGVARALMDGAACILLFPLIVLAGANSVPAGAFARMCATVGGLSYAIYVLQAPIILSADAGLNFLFDRSLSSFDEVGTVAIGIVVVVVAFVATTFYDAPVQRWLSDPRTSAANQNFSR